MNSSAAVSSRNVEGVLASAENILRNKCVIFLLYRQAVSIAQVQALLPPSPPPSLDQASEGSGIVFFSLHLARKLKPCSLPHFNKVSRHIDWELFSSSPL